MTGPLDRLRTLFAGKDVAEATSSAKRPNFRAAQDVAFLRADAFRIETCPLCHGRPTGHLSVYPAMPKSRMRGSIAWWCDVCGSGFLPHAKSLIDGYYEQHYSVEVKPDRVIEPEVYFSPEARKVSTTIDRHLRRVEHQIATLNRIGGTYETVLDFGSGPGYFLQMFDPPQKFAVELDLASQKFLDHIGAKNVRLEDVPRGSLDLIMASHIMEHLLIEELDATLGSMLVALKHGGLLYIEVPQAALTALELPYRHEPHSIFFSPNGLTRAVKRAGFEIIERSYRSSGRVKFRDNAIWTPNPNDKFEAKMGAGITVIGRRRQKAVRA